MGISFLLIDIFPFDFSSNDSDICTPALRTFFLRLLLLSLRGCLWTLSAPALLMSAEENPHLQPARAVGALGHLGQGASGARKMAV